MEQTATVINLNLLSQYVNASEQSNELHLCSPNLHRENDFIHIFAKHRALCTCQELLSCSTGSLFQETWHTFILGGLMLGDTGELAFPRWPRLILLQPWRKAAWVLH